jgi:hypothetical protein
MKSPLSAGCQWLVLIILAIQETETGKSTVQGQLRQKVWEPPSQQIAWHGGTSYHPNLGSIKRRITVQAGPRLKVRPYLEKNQNKKSWMHDSSDKESTCLASTKSWVQTLVPPKKISSFLKLERQPSHSFSGYFSNLGAPAVCQACALSGQKPQTMFSSLCFLSPFQLALIITYPFSSVAIE